MEKVKLVKFKVKRQLSCKNRRQFFYVESNTGGIKPLHSPVTIYRRVKSPGSPLGIRIEPVLLQFRDRAGAEAASRRLHRRINRPLPQGLSTLEWISKEADKIIKERGY